MTSTRYLVRSTVDDAKFYPLQDGSGKLTAWVRKFDAPRYTRAEAVFMAAKFEEHIRTWNGLDRVEVVPAGGGAAISRHV